MMFGRHRPRSANPGARILAALALAATFAAPALAGSTAVVSERVIYPGEEIPGDILKVVAVTNPNLRGGYAEVLQQVDGMIATRTLLPGRTIPLLALRQPWAVERGSAVPLIFSHNGLTITATGTPMQNASIGDFIRVRNVESGIIIQGTVMADGTIRVAPQ